MRRWRRRQSPQSSRQRASPTDGGADGGTANGGADGSAAVPMADNGADGGQTVAPMAEQRWYRWRCRRGADGGADSGGVDTHSADPLQVISGRAPSPLGLCSKVFARSGRTNRGCRAEGLPGCVTDDVFSHLPSRRRTAGPGQRGLHLPTGGTDAPFCQIRGSPGQRRERVDRGPGARRCRQRLFADGTSCFRLCTGPGRRSTELAAGLSGDAWACRAGQRPSPRHGPKVRRPLRRSRCVRPADRRP